MLNPAIPLEPSEALVVAKMIVLRSPDLGEPSRDIRYERDPQRAGGFARRDQWQRPEQTEQLKRGDCEDLMLRWASWIARRRPVFLACSRTGPRLRHWFLIDATTGAVIDPSVERGMKPPRPEKYKRELVKMLLTPNEFDSQAEDGAGVAIQGDQASAALGATAAGLAPVGTSLATIYPPAGAVVGVLAAAAGLTKGVLDASIADARRRAKAKKGKRGATRSATQAQRAATVLPLRSPPARILAAAKAQNIPPEEVKRAQEARLLVSAARAGDPRARAGLARLMARPVVRQDGTPDKDVLAVRIAQASDSLFGPPPVDKAAVRLAFNSPKASPTKLIEATEVDELLDDEDDDEADDGEGACCDGCAKGKKCAGDACDSGHGDDDEDDEADGDDDEDDEADGDDDEDDEADGDDDEDDGDDDEADGDDDEDDEADGDDDEDDEADGDDDEDEACATGTCPNA